MNEYLKEIADICQITKTLTYHIVRYTFAITVTLNDDVPIESVSKMLGHESLKQTQHYAKVLNKKVSQDMELLSKRLSVKLFDTKLPSRCVDAHSDTWSHWSSDIGRKPGKMEAYLYQEAQP